MSSAEGMAMNSNHLPRVLRDALGRLPGDPLRGARLKTMLQPAVLELWDKGHASDFTDAEIEKAVTELVDEEIVRRLADEFEQSERRSGVHGTASHSGRDGICNRPKDPNRA
ncbi:hypothetical protein PY365_29595 [Roseiarcaceae bacterium H3SJ34-1]|uniref:hypothetical protein n=1 Tax=Terripilifer ovatus TaxID=3032367 RepID=UPI003AB94B78|nr:hypothetical protein [Roseiarcaceae bacterium H3SJ34-1]